MSKLWTPYSEPEGYIRDPALKALADMARDLGLEMVTPTYAQLHTLSNATNVSNAEELFERILTCLAILASGQNPDGTVNGGASGIFVPSAPLDGFQAVTATTGATTLVTVPQGRTWQGWIGSNCTAQVVAAGTAVGQATVVWSVSGAGANPSGNVLQVEAFAAANAAGGTTGTSASSSLGVPITVVAGAGAAALIQTTVTASAAGGHANSFAIGALVA